MSGEALTIGEVIGRLAADFPDLTVSKIRYLESGGLISPGRTPAGYRRFTEEDVEKLRWVLAAQRDQYLPLKVIRQHLAADGPRVTAGDAEAIVAALTSGADLSGEAGHDADAAAVAGSLQDPDAASSRVEAGTARARTFGSPGSPGSPGSAGSPGSPGAPGTARAATAEGAAGELPPPATLTPPLPPLPHPRSRAATVADPEFYLTARSDVGELHLGREALARTAGVSESFLTDLIGFGLLPDAGDYGGDAVFVVRAASALTEYGLEPRHLRPLLTGARNTAGLLGTLLPARRHDGVTGTGRQAAAIRAATRTAEASAAVVKLYAALLRAELSPGAFPTPRDRSASATPPAPSPAASPASSPLPPANTASAEPADLARPAPAETPSAPPAPASQASSRNPGMPGGPAAR